MNPFFENINTNNSVTTSTYLRGKREEHSGRKTKEREDHHDHYPYYDQISFSNNQNNNSNGSIISSSTCSFETLLPKNGFYNLDAFFDSDIISLDGTISSKEEGEYDPTDEQAVLVVNDSKERMKSEDITLTPPDCTKNHCSKSPLPCEEKNEEPSFSLSQGKVLNNFEFQSLKRKVDAVAVKKDGSCFEEPSRNKKIKIQTSPIQVPRRRSDEDKVEFSDETRQLGTSLSIEIFRKHYNIAKFKESDRGCKRDHLEVGYAGLACAYCDGTGNGRRGGRYFPSSLKTMADPNKVLLSMYNHLQKCSECPISTKQHLAELRELYDGEKYIQERGTQRKFYRAIWDSLRKKDDVSE